MAGQPDKYNSCVLGDEKYLFTLNHEGRWAAEDMLNREWPDIVYQYNVNNAGTRVQTAIIFALTRKHHTRELPNPRSVMKLLDVFDDATEEEQVDFSAALHAALTGVPKKELIEEYEKDKAEEDEPAADEEEDEAEKEGEDSDGPKESEPEKTTKKPSGSRSAAGKGTNKKQ